MSQHLFDPAPFAKGKPKEQRRRKVRSAPEVIVVTIGEDGWAVLANGRGAHRVIVNPMDSGGNVTTACSITGSLLTVDDGTQAGACPKCLR